MSTIIQKGHSQTIVQKRDGNVVVDRRGASTIRQGAGASNTIQERDGNIVVKERTSNTMEVNRGPAGPPGMQGPPGPAGGSTIEMEAGETIFGLRVVRALDDQIFHPDVDDPDHAEQVIGIALQSGTGTLQVQVSGQLVEGSWTWTPGLVYCGDDGVLTQSPAATGWLLAVGRAIAADTINVDIDTAFFRG